MKTIKILFLISLLFVICGFVFKLNDVLGAGTFMGVGFMLMIIASSVWVIKEEKLKVYKYIIWIGVVVFSSLLFTIIQHRDIVEILSFCLILAIVTVFITFAKRHL